MKHTAFCLPLDSFESQRGANSAILTIVAQKLICNFFPRSHVKHGNEITIEKSGFFWTFDTPSPKGTGILEECKSELSMVLAITPWTLKPTIFQCWHCAYFSFDFRVHKLKSINYSTTCHYLPFKCSALRLISRLPGFLRTKLFHCSCGYSYSN